jgi:hypothetical protein
MSSKVLRCSLPVFVRSLPAVQGPQTSQSQPENEDVGRTAGRLGRVCKNESLAID